MPSENEPFDPVVLDQLIVDCLGELRSEDEEFAKRLANRIDELRSQLDSGTFTDATLDRVWDATPNWLAAVWIQRGLTDEPPENRLVDRSRARDVDDAESVDLPATNQLLTYLRNHPIDLARWRRPDQPRRIR